MGICEDGKFRCFGDAIGEEFYAKYHDEEWGNPVYDDIKFFEMLILEGAQAGLSWKTVLQKREGYREVFHDFDVKKVSQMTDEELEKLRNDSRIIRNKLKINSVRKNARVFMAIQKEFGSFANYVWSFVGNEQIKNSWQTYEEVPVTTKESDNLSKDLKKRGMSFVGPTIMYAFMQATGVVDDHLTCCWKYKKSSAG